MVIVRDSDKTDAKFWFDLRFSHSVVPQKAQNVLCVCVFFFCCSRPIKLNNCQNLSSCVYLCVRAIFGPNSPNLFEFSSFFFHLILVLFVVSNWTKKSYKYRNEKKKLSCVWYIFLTFSLTNRAFYSFCCFFFSLNSIYFHISTSGSRNCATKAETAKKHKWKTNVVWAISNVCLITNK